MDAHHVARLDDNPIPIEYLTQVFIGDEAPSVAEMCVQVEHDGAALNAFRGHVLDAQLSGFARCLRRNVTDGTGVSHVGRPNDVDAAPIPIVEHYFGDAIVIGIEELSHVREAIPLA